MKIRWKRLNEKASNPYIAHPGDAGIDLCASEQMTIGIGKFCKVPTGLSFEIPDGFYGALKPRSSVFMRGLVCDCVVDSGYRGEVYMGFINTTIYPITVEAGERLAQMIILPVQSIELSESDELSESSRGAGGFGSTGSGSRTTGNGG